MSSFEFLISPKVTATDGDRDRPENVVYSLDGVHADRFGIDRASGEISVLTVIFLRKPFTSKFTIF